MTEVCKLFSAGEGGKMQESHKEDNRANLHSQFIVTTAAIFVWGVIILFGVIGNIINMVIFYKQGLNTTINISLFSLAISDLCSLIFQEIGIVYSNPLFVNLDLPIVYREIQYFTTDIIRELFAKITCLLTVYITAERCFCIAFPLHVSQMITPRRTVTTIICIYTSVLLSGSPAFGISYIDWNFHQNINRTLLGLVYRQNTQIADGIVYLIHAILGILVFITMVLLTSVLIYKLDRKSTWLRKANLDAGKAESMSSRDKVTMKMVILIACILIMCFLPSVVLLSVTIFEPEFHIEGAHKKLFITLWTLAVFLENINSSVNIFFYYKMSTRYRQTFRAHFFKTDRQGNLY